MEHKSNFRWCVRERKGRRERERERKYNRLSNWTRSELDYHKQFIKLDDLDPEPVRLKLSQVIKI